MIYNVLIKRYLEEGKEFTNKSDVIRLHSMEEHPQARQIVETLNKAGFVAYYAGGWVRDLLLQHPSDDIDIATNAPPETIQALFPKTVPIGIAFGIVLVIIDGHEYEVATFRQDLDYKDGRRPSKIEFSTAIEDAKRRDFTINGMFYDPIKNELYDYVGGQADLKQKLIRAIGNPHQRIKEDRLRMIRAVRLACRFHFSIDPATEQAIRDHAKELFPAVAIERIVQELEKGRAFGHLKSMLLKLHEFGLLVPIFPSLQEVSREELEKRVAPLASFPKEAPLIACILELFPHSSLSEQLALVKTLKLSNSDQQFTLYLFSAKELMKKKNGELFDWAHFYAHPHSSLVLQLIASHLHGKEKAEFLLEQNQRQKLLKHAIGRIIAKNPVVRSEDLLSIGMEPGPLLGEALKAAERMAINEQIEDKKIILDRLKKKNPR